MISLLINVSFAIETSTSEIYMITHIGGKACFQPKSTTAARVQFWHVKLGNTKTDLIKVLHLQMI